MDEFKLIDLIGETLDECNEMMRQNRDDVNWPYLSNEIKRIMDDTGANREQVVDALTRMAQSPSRRHVGRWIEPILQAQGAVKEPEPVKKPEPKPVVAVPEAPEPAKIPPHEQAARNYVHNLVYKNYWPNSSMACAEMAILLLKCYNEYNVPVEETLDAVYRQSRYAQGVENWNKEMMTMLDNFKGYKVVVDGA